MLAAISHEPQKSATGAFVLTILIQMCRELFDTAGQERDLHLRRAGISVVALNLADFVLLLSLRQHEDRISQSCLHCKAISASLELVREPLQAQLRPSL